VNDPQIEGDATKIACMYKALPQTVSVGATIYIGGGGLTCEVTETHDDYIMVQCKNDFMLKDKQKMNLPGAIISAETMTEKDIDDVTEFGLKN
jgi:pyruvate kinase